MDKVKRKNRTIAFIVSICLLLICGVFCISTRLTVRAESSERADSYNFSLVTDSDGVQSYSVSVKPILKPTIENVIIPEEYNGIPVTEIANNGFLACAKLRYVYLPTTVKKIGNNAFMNCANLVRIGLGHVESVASNAFAMCPKLDNTYIPKTVKSMGDNVFRNNANRIYIQCSKEEVDAEWKSTWSNYFTGDTYYQVESGGYLNYTAILNDQKEKIGYEIDSYQFIENMDADIVVYNSLKLDDDTQYYPILNVRSEAFTFSNFKSITFKDRRTIDPNAPEMTHSLNIRSNAFTSAFCSEIVFETSVSFNHPERLVDTPSESMYDGSEIVGDCDGHSVKIFEESTVASITLPTDITFIPNRMFYDCAYLETIKFYGVESDNVLESVIHIGSEAFSSCGSILEITLPSSITSVGEAAFEHWGEGANRQIINIDYYEGFLPSGWSDGWFGGEHNNTDINYIPPVEITIDYLYNDITVIIEVIPELYMPDIEMPQRAGYSYNGIYSGKKGAGNQYYTDTMGVNKLWNEGETTTLYVNWEIIHYTIFYPEELGDIYNPNPHSFTVEDSVVLQNIEDDMYIYTFDPDIIPKGTTGNQYLFYAKKEKDFEIQYVFDAKGCVNNNPDTYKASKQIVFEKLEHEGYTFEWSPASTPTDNPKDLVVVGTWTPISYNITYNNVLFGTNNPNPDTYKYNEEDDFVLQEAILGGYYVSWDIKVFPAGTMGDMVVTASYTEKTLRQCYNTSTKVYEIWTIGQFNQLRDESNGGSGREYWLMAKLQAGQEHITHIFRPLAEFRGVLDGRGLHVNMYTLDVTSGGNLGFCKINYGTIKNLTLGIGYDVDDTYSNVNIGVFAGINKGKIINCGCEFSGSTHKCDAIGKSNAGIFSGINEGTIDGCFTANIYMYGSCNMGLVAGQNSGNITNCNVGTGNTKIEYRYYNKINSCIGGIVGLQTAGSVTNSSFKGMIAWGNLQLVDDRSVQPCVGIIIGYKQGGIVNGNSWKYTDSTDIVVSTFPPSVVTWTSGSRKYTHDQGLYFKNEECGRID